MACAFNLVGGGCQFDPNEANAMVSEVHRPSYDFVIEEMTDGQKGVMNNNMLYVVLVWLRDKADDTWPKEVHNNARIRNSMQAG